MIQEIRTDIFKFKTDALLHSCNCQNKMGAGIALTIKQNYPEVFLADQNLKESTAKFGKVLPVKLNNRLHQYCFNCYTQYDYGREKRQVDYEAVYNCMEKVEFKSQQLGLKTLSIPWKISCVNAGGSWSVIKSMIDDIFISSILTVFICKL